MTGEYLISPVGPKIQSVKFEAAPGLVEKEVRCESCCNVGHTAGEIAAAWGEEMEPSSNGTFSNRLTMSRASIMEILIPTFLKHLSEYTVPVLSPTLLCETLFCRI